MLLSVLLYALIARWYVAPRLAGLLALAAILAWRARSPVAAPLTWLFTIVGILDLVHAFYQGLSHDVQLGAAYFISTFIVPGLVITHVMIVGRLVRDRR